VLNNIPAWPVVLLGLIACSREVYVILWHKRYKNLGSLFAFGYTTIVYVVIAGGSFGDANITRPFVRIGVMLIVLDKAMAFLFEIFERWVVYRAK